MTVAQYAHANRVTACYQKMNTNSCHYEIFFSRNSERFIEGNEEKFSQYNMPQV